MIESSAPATSADPRPRAGPADVAQPQRGAWVVAALDPAGAFGLRASERGQRHVECRDAPGGGDPLGEPRIVVDHPIERRLHEHERRCRLHDLAQRERAVEELRRAQNDR